MAAEALRRARLAPLRGGRARAASSRASPTSGSTSSRSLHKLAAAGALRRPATVPGDRVRRRHARCAARARSCASSSERAPDPPLLPADARGAARVEEAEEWGDQVLQPLARRDRCGARCRATPARSVATSRARSCPSREPLARSRAPVVARPRRADSTAARDPAVRADLINLDCHLDRADKLDREGHPRRRASPTPPTCRSAPASGCCSTLEDLVPRIEGRPVRRPRAAAGSRTTRAATRPARSRARGSTRGLLPRSDAAADGWSTAAAASGPVLARSV